MKSLKALLNTILTAVSLLLFSATSSQAENQTNAAGWTAQETTNPPTGTVIQKRDKKVSISGELGNHPYGLPPEILEKLSPEQIVELTKSRNAQSRAEDVIIPLAGMAIPIVLFISFVGVVALVISHRLKKAQLLHETIRAMIEKGQPIPPELLQPREPRHKPTSDLGSGLVLIGVGIALLVMFYHSGNTARALGLIPLLMGVAFLVTWKVEQNKKGNSK